MLWIAPFRLVDQEKDFLFQHWIAHFRLASGALMFPSNPTQGSVYFILLIGISTLLLLTNSLAACYQENNQKAVIVESLITELVSTDRKRNQQKT
jgi:hypothetical protein